MSEVKELFIEDSLSPISIESTEIILDQMKNSVCEIHLGKTGTGFFVRIPYNNQILKLLITNNHVLNEKDIMIDNTISISLNNKKIRKEIKIDSNRKTYTNEKLDVTIIEIKDEDNINNNYLLLDEAIIDNEINNYSNIYKNQSIYILNYMKDKDIQASYGILNNIEDNKIIHKCSTDSGSSGSPIILLNNNKVIGVHYAGSKHNKNFNFGRLLKQPLLEYINKENKINKTNKQNKNYIISEIEIKEEDIDNEIRIINSFEEYKRKNGKFDKILEEDYCLYENEKEIKDNCIIKINNDIIYFNYFYKFKVKGKYNIEYIFTNNLTKTDFMFCECKSLTNINLSNFNTEKVTNMGGMFLGCESLINIDLSKLITQNVTNMTGMFFGCRTLTNINLTKINTQNVTIMSGMFCGCRDLTNIDLSNIDTHNVINFSGMFYGCRKLIKINLSNFNTEKATNMSEMFNRCHSLTDIDLSNFNTQNVTNMSEMFSKCNSLKKENIVTKDNKVLNNFKI